MVIPLPLPQGHGHIQVLGQQPIPCTSVLLIDGSKTKFSSTEDSHCPPPLKSPVTTHTSSSSHPTSARGPHDLLTGEMDIYPGPSVPA